MAVLNRYGPTVFRANMIARFAVWLCSMGWLSYGVSAYSDGDAIGFWLAACCFAGATAVDGLLENWAEAKRARHERLVDLRRALETTDRQFRIGS